MNIQSLILFLIIGLAAGWLASKLLRGGSLGLMGDLVVGMVGAILGGWLFNLLGISLGGIIGSLVTALVGALVLIYLLRLIKKV